MNLIILLSFIAINILPALAWIPFVGQEIHKHHSNPSQNGEWDILQLVALNKSSKGVSHGSPGPLDNTTTFRLKDRTTHARLSPTRTKEMVSHFSDSLSAYFVFRQHNNTVASLLGTKLAGNMKPWFQITSDLKRRRLQIIYRVKTDSQSHQITFHLPEKVGSTWTKLLVSINATQIKVWVNCNHLEKAMLDAPIDLKLPEGGIFYFGQEPDFKNPLMGSVQAVKLFNFGMSSKLWRCEFDGQFGPAWKPPLLG